MKKAIGRITNPKSGAKVARSFHVEGEIFDLPKYNCHIWLAIEMRHGGITRLWPRTSELLLTEGRWSYHVEEHGSPPQEGFSLILLQVNDDSNRLIKNLQRYSKMTGSHPGLRWFNISPDSNAGIYMLDRIDNLQLR